MRCSESVADAGPARLPGGAHHAVDLHRADHDIGGGAIGVTTFGLAGGYALSGRGRRWLRRNCGGFAVLGVLLMAFMASAMHPRGRLAVSGWRSPRRRSWRCSAWPARSRSGSAYPPRCRPGSPSAWARSPGWPGPRRCARSCGRWPGPRPMWRPSTPPGSSCCPAQ